MKKIAFLASAPALNTISHICGSHSAASKLVRTGNSGDDD
jgi:hypothetical protein